ncbi:hypothetical protein L228DRAFT_95403 [Xylona heveae TC161]|uniref:HIT-type domain-containing protein n=1 Tax=Xylona heveae (strain CBS 132557 / TC161) TaxID=1328760 RepID=A0A165I4U0_XYLHT|nr:hypothetical protein L228DRAFT_95403 [Xylona heveae TC161]KZF24382.1 hypothetical protein L228DRAFT_95403 [Xylona heveae TC161]
MSQKSFANHLGDEEAALANQTGPISAIEAPPAKLTKTSSSRGKRASTSASVEPNSAQVTPGVQCQLPASAVTTPPSPEESDPLLKSIVPSPPSPEEISALVSAPPLTYNAARVNPSDSDLPQRYFCEICGYWGRVRCLKCGTRVCGLECKGIHDEGRCLRFYA